MKNSATERWKEGQAERQAALGGRGGHTEQGREGLDQGTGGHRPKGLGLTVYSVLSTTQRILHFRCLSLPLL